MPEESRFVVEVVPDVTGIDRTFDYFVPDGMKGSIEIGSRVRVNLNGRRVGGWVVACEPRDTSESELKPILKCSGIGPDETIVSLSRWAANRWCVGKLDRFSSQLLRTPWCPESRLRVERKSWPHRLRLRRANC